MKVLIIIPAYNEQDNILKTVQGIIDYKKANQLEYELDYIVINDGSTDKTLDVCEKNNINVIDLFFNLGIGGAVQTGYLYAKRHGYDAAVQFDGDGQHDIQSLNDVLYPILLDECDMCIGSRFVDSSRSEFKSSLPRRIGIKCISLTMRLVCKINVKDATSGFRAVNSKLIARFADKYPSEYPEPESTADAAIHGYRVKEVGANMFERANGNSSIKAVKSFYYMINVVLSIILLKIFKR